jgi:hypothetical protein
VLDDFPIGVSRGPERFTVICRDVPTAVFFYEFPNSLPMTACFEQSPEAQKRAEFDRFIAWMFGLLPRVAVEPRLSLEVMHRLEEAAALEGVIGYLHAVGWVLDEDLARQAAMEGEWGEAARRYQRTRGALGDEMLPVISTAPPRYGDLHKPFTTELAPNIRLALRDVAKRARVRPSLLWRTPISEYLLDFRLLIKDERPGSHLLTPEDAAIGFETYD